MDGGSTVQPASTSGGLAYDPLLGEFVLFGGCAAVCPDNFTWVYNGIDWVNATSGLATLGDGLPPSVEGMELAWDPLWGGLVMTGGSVVDGAGSNQTWLFNSTGWWNITPLVGATNAPGSVFGSMAYDGALHELVAVGGCRTTHPSCAGALYGGTYALGGTHAPWKNISSTFSPGAASPGSPLLGAYGASMAYDPDASELLYFGGLTASAAVQNSTWVMNGTGWYNVTETASGCISSITTTSCYYPKGVAFGGLTWDGQLGDAVLIGGYNSTFAATASTYVFERGAWYPPCLVGLSVCPTTEPAPGYDGELASNSSDVAPLWVGAECASGPCVGDSWVFEVPPQVSITATSPDPSEVGVGVRVGVSVQTGSGCGPVMYEYLGDNVSNAYSSSRGEINFSTPVTYGTTLGYGAVGTYSVYAAVSDFFYVEEYAAPVRLVVNASVAAAPSANPRTTDLGGVVTFTAGASLGVPPYRYLWGFGDASGGSTSPAPTHVYAASGTYHGWVIVTDRLGASTNASFAVAVDPALMASVSANVSVTDAGGSVAFVGTASGGSGVYSTVAWQFGSGSPKLTGGGRVSHPFGTAGTYTVYYNVTDSLGFTASALTTVTVNTALTGVLTSSTLTPGPGQSVSFFAVPLGGTGPYRFAWQFGDGSGAPNEPFASHIYPRPGQFEVNVTISDGAGFSVTQHVDVTVSSPAEGILGELAGGAMPYVLGGGLAAVAVVLALALVRRRRKRPGADPTALSTVAAPAQPAGGTGPSGDARPERGEPRPSARR